MRQMIYYMRKLITSKNAFRWSLCCGVACPESKSFFGMQMTRARAHTPDSRTLRGSRREEPLLSVSESIAYKLSLSEKLGWSQSGGLNNPLRGSCGRF